MGLQKVQDNLACLGNLNKGDILLFSRNGYIDNLAATPDNIFWVEYSNNQGVSLKSFTDRSKFVLYPELQSSNYWFFHPSI